VYPAVDSYIVSLTVTNGSGCSNTFTDTIQLSEAPVALIEGKDKDGDTRYCLSGNDSSTTDTVYFHNLSKNAQSFRWDFGDGSPLLTTGSKEPIMHVYTTYGTFKVTMIAISSQNCEKSATLTVIFSRSVKAGFTLQPSEITGCVPLAVMPVNTSLNANEFIWSFGDGTPAVTTTNAAPFVHIYKKTGTFVISLKSSNSCSAETFTGDTIHVIGIPDSKFEISPLNGCAPQVVAFNNLTAASAANTYHWSFGDGSVWNGNSNPETKIYEKGKWKIQLTATNGCGSDSSFQWLNVLESPPVPAVENETI
jgi:PKD repeat protein